MSNNILDLLTEFLKFNCFLSSAVKCGAHSKASFIHDSLVTVDPTSLDQHKLYCTIALSLSCEIYDDLMVLIWKFVRDMPMNDTKGNELLSGLFGSAVHKYLTG